MDITFALRKFRKSIAGFTILAIFASFFSFAGLALAFDDVDDDAWYAEYVETASDEGWMTGYEDGTFGPDDTLTRAQLAKVAVLAFLGEDLVDEDYDAGFTDLEDGAWYVEYVNTAELYELVSGYEDEDGDLTGEFGPDDEVNRAAAAKILVMAAGLTLTSEGGPHFDDVDEDAWYYDYVETAYLYSIVSGYEDGDYGPGDGVTRAQAAKMTALAQDPTYIGDDDDDDDDDDDAEVGTLTITVSEDTPAGSTLPDLCTGVEVATWDFTAEDGDVELDEVIITQYGISALATDHQVYLYEGDIRLTSGTTINATTYDAKFNNLNLEVEDGETRSLSVRIDVGTGNSSDELAIELTDADSVVSDATEDLSTYPLQGEVFAIAADDAGTITVEKNGTVSNPKVGEDDVVIAKLKLSASSTELAQITNLALLLTGTVSVDDVENFELYVSGEDEALATVEGVDSNDLIQFALETPYEIAAGGSKSFTVQADFNTGRTDDTVEVYLDEDTDITAVGGKYGYGLAVTRTLYDGNSNSCGASSDNDCSYSTLEGGDVTISSSGPGATDVAVNGKDVVLMDFTIASVGEVTFKNFPISITPSEDTSDDTEGLLDGTTSNLTDIKISNTETGDELMTAVDANVLTTDLANGTAIDDTTNDTDDSASYHLYTDDFTMEAGEELSLALTADIANTATLADMTVQAILELGHTVASYPEIRDVNNKQLTNTSILVPASDIAGKTMTLKSPSLTMSLASTPVAATTNIYVKGATDVPFVGMTFACGDASDCKITDLTLYGAIDENSTGGFTAGVDATPTPDVTVAQIVGSVALWDSTDPETANVIATAESVNSTTGAVAYTNMDWTISAGDTEIIYVVGDISTSSYLNDFAEDIAFYLAATSDLTAEDVDGNSISTKTGTPNGPLVTDITVYASTSDGGSLTVAVAGDTPNEDIVIAGDTDVEISKFKFTATDEAFVVTSLAVNARQSGVATADLGDYDHNISKITLSYTDSDGVTEEKNGYLTDGIATFSGMDFAVGADEDAYVTVYADINTLSNGATNAEFIDLSLAFNNFSATAGSSGETYNASKLDDGVDGGSDLDFGTMTFVDTTKAHAASADAVVLNTTDTVTVPDLVMTLPIGTLLKFGAESTTYDETEDILMVLTTGYTEADLTVTGLILNDDDADANGNQIYYALPGTGYLSNSNHMHVQENKPVLALSSSSPSGSRSVSATDEAFIFTVTADSNDDIFIRPGLAPSDDTDGLHATMDDAEIETTAVGGNVIDGAASLLYTAATIADEDCFLFNTAFTAGTTEGTLGYYDYMSFWLMQNGDPSYDSIAIAFDNDNTCAAGGDDQLILGASTMLVNGTATAGTGAVAGGTDDLWVLVTVDISGTVTANNTYVGFSVETGGGETTPLVNGDDLWFDGVVLHNEMIYMDITSDTDFNIDETAGLAAYLKESGNTIATSAVGWLDTTGATAGIMFVPIYGTDTEIEITAGTTSTYTVELDSGTLLDEDSGVDDPLTFSMSLGSSSAGTVTPGDYWWSTMESSAGTVTYTTVRWAGRVDSTTLTSNTVNY